MEKDYINMQKIKQLYNIRVCLYKINIKVMARCYLLIKENIKDNLKIIYFMDKDNIIQINLYILVIFIKVEYRVKV
jgi:hypothetical protein